MYRHILFNGKLSIIVHLLDTHAQTVLLVSGRFYFFIAQEASQLCVILWRNYNKQLRHLLA